MAQPLADTLGDAALEQEAWQRLQEVYDPELGIDLVNLGLVYELQVHKGALVVAMTLTTPGCPMGGSIPDQVRFRLGMIPGVREVEVELVWQPPWEPEMMSPAAKQALGWS
jgi:metal-sulfur cluster biosynthetic enzyme